MPFELSAANAYEDALALYKGQQDVPAGNVLGAFVSLGQGLR